jgi:hypothetical protein
MEGYMEYIKLITVMIILATFGLIVFAMIRSERNRRAVQQNLAQALGFTPIEPSPELTKKFADFYIRIRSNWVSANQDQYELQNVYQKRLPDGEMLIFDLLDHSGNDTSYTESAAVAVISPHLDLPYFSIFPKADVEGPLAKLGNKFLTWIVSNAGNPVAFPENPEFEKRYLVSSTDPFGTHEFLDDTRLRRLRKTPLMSISAGGDMFTASRIETGAPRLTKEILTERVVRATEVFSIFLS